MPSEAMDAASAALGSEIVSVGRLTGGVNGGAVRLRTVAGTDAVLKTEVLQHPEQLAAAERAGRIVEHMRSLGYPTPAWLAAGATTGHLWRVTEFVDADPVVALTPAIVDQLLDVVDLQAGAATEPYDHWTYAWHVAVGGPATREPSVETREQAMLRRSIARLPEHSPAVRDLVRRVQRLVEGMPAPTRAPDMVHADLNPGNVLVRDGVVVALVDVGNAGSGTRATDLTTLVWNAFDDGLDEVRARLRTRILDVVGQQGALLLAGAQSLFMLEVAVRDGRPEAVSTAIDRARRLLTEFGAPR